MSKIYASSLIATVADAFELNRAVSRARSAGVTINNRPVVVMAQSSLKRGEQRIVDALRANGETLTSDLYDTARREIERRERDRKRAIEKRKREAEARRIEREELEEMGLI